MFSKKAAIFSLSPVTQTNIEFKWTFVKYLKIALLFTSIHFCLLAWLSSRSKTILIPLKSRQNSHFKGWHYILFASSANDRSRYNTRGGKIRYAKNYPDGKYAFSNTKKVKECKILPKHRPLKKAPVHLISNKAQCSHSLGLLHRVTHGIPSDKLPQREQ